MYFHDFKVAVISSKEPFAKKTMRRVYAMREAKGIHAVSVLVADDDGKLRWLGSEEVTTKESLPEKWPTIPH